MMTLMEHLESFNTKERFFLVVDTLGNPDFQRSAEFQAKLREAFGIRPPNHAFVAMDYHLDWRHVGLFLALPEEDEVRPPRRLREEFTDLKEDQDGKF